jgi:hypothetical protein
MTNQFGIRYWLLSCGAGVGLFILISFLADTAADPIFLILARPGMALAAVAGFGAHDLQGFALYLLGNMAFYSALFLGLFRFLRIGVKRPGES